MTWVRSGRFTWRWHRLRLKIRIEQFQENMIQHFYFFGGKITFRGVYLTFPSAKCVCFLTPSPLVSFQLNVDIIEQAEKEKDCDWRIVVWWRQTAERRLISVWQTTSRKYLTSEGKYIHQILPEYEFIPLKYLVGRKYIHQRLHLDIFG